MIDHDQHIIVTTTDLERLRPVLDQSNTPTSDLLDDELQRAHIVAAKDVPADVVTMNSEIVYEDCETGTTRTVRIVYPKDADATNGSISVLAPIGSALLGLRVGQSIRWAVPHGTKELRVVEVRYQPEAAGDYER